VTVEFLGCHEVLQVLVVRPDLHWVSGSFQEIPLLFQCMDDGEHLFVVDLVVLFYWRQGFAVEGHWVPFIHSSVTPQVNFAWKITFDMLYTNEFVIRVCSRALAISSERTTI